VASPFFTPCEGPITGLRLPRNTWAVLEREDIRPLDQLRAVIPHIDCFRDIGPKTAQIIRDEFTRVVLSEEPTSGGDATCIAG
jgi:hypothetical protein